MKPNLYTINYEEAVNNLIDYWHSTNDLSYHQHSGDSVILSLREFLRFTEIEYEEYIKLGNLPKNIKEILTVNHMVRLEFTDNLQDENIHTHRYSNELELLMLDIREVATFYYLVQYRNIIYIFCGWADCSLELIELSGNNRVTIKESEMHNRNIDIFEEFKKKLSKNSII